MDPDTVHLSCNGRETRLLVLLEGRHRLEAERRLPEWHGMGIDKGRPLRERIPDRLGPLAHLLATTLNTIICLLLIFYRRVLGVGWLLQIKYTNTCQNHTFSTS